MDLSSLYDSFSKLTINDTQSPQDALKAEPYSIEVRLWSEFSEILKKHNLQDYPILHNPELTKNLSYEDKMKKIAAIEAKIDPTQGTLLQDINEWVEDVKLCINKRVLDQRNVNFFATLVKRYEDSVPTQTNYAIMSLFDSLLYNLNKPSLSLKTENFENRFYKKKYMVEYCHQKIDYYSTLLRKTQESVTAICLSPEKEKDQTKIKELHKVVVFARKQLRKWQCKLTHLKSKHILSKPYQYSKMDETLGISYIHAQGQFGKGVRVGLVEQSPLSPTRTAHVYHSKALSKSLEIPTSDHTQHTIGTIVAPAKTIHERLGIAPLSSLSFARISKDTTLVIECRVDDKNYLLDINEWEFVEPEYALVDGIPTISRYKTSEPQPFSYPFPSNLVVLGGSYSSQQDEEMKNNIEKLLDEGVEILSFSCALSYGPKFQQALEKFVEQGGVIVKAAGNSGHKLTSELSPTRGTSESEAFSAEQKLAYHDTGFFKMIKENPKLYQSTLLVGNLQDDEHLAKNSCQAGEFASCYIAAWGTDILSTSADGRNYGLEKKSGTSMATPMVAGVLAVLKGAWPHVKARELAAILLETATPIGDLETFGMGRLNAEAAFVRARELFGPPTKA